MQTINFAEDQKEPCKEAVPYIPPTKAASAIHVPVVCVSCLVSECFTASAVSGLSLRQLWTFLMIQASTALPVKAEIACPANGAGFSFRDKERLKIAPQAMREQLITRGNLSLAQGLSKDMMTHQCSLCGQKGLLHRHSCS